MPTQEIVFDNNNKSYYDNENNNFFDKKKILIIAFWILITAVLIGLTFKFVLDINFVEITNLIISSHRENKMFWLWFLLLFVFPIWNVFLRIFDFYYKLKKKNIFVKWHEWINFSLLTFFIGGITPFATGAEPYMIYWLKRKGLTFKEASAIIVSFSVVNPFVQIVITWPSFFYLCSIYQENINNLPWIVCFWSVFVGLIFDLFASISWVVLGASKNVHYWIMLLWNKIKKIAKLKYKNNDEIRKEFKENQEFKKMFIAELKDYKFLAWLIVSTFVWNILYYVTYIFAFNLLDANFSYNAFYLFNYVNVSVTANNFIPIPGAEGTLQSVIITFIKFSENVGTIPNLDVLATGSTYIWRLSTFYSTTLLGLLSFISLLIQNLKNLFINRMKVKKGINTQRTFTFVIKEIGDLDKLLITLNSIRWCDYNQKLVQIILITKENLLDHNKYHKIHWFDVEIVQMNSNNNWEIINELNKQQLINFQYVSIINSGEVVTYETLKMINKKLNESDIYLGAYRKINSKKISIKRKPYLSFFDLKINKKEQMKKAKFIFSSLYFKNKLIDQQKELVKSTKQNKEFFEDLVQKTSTLSYFNSIFIYRLEK